MKLRICVLLLFSMLSMTYVESGVMMLSDMLLRNLLMTYCLVLCWMWIFYDVLVVSMLIVYLL